jgi:DNA-binding NarL/FixJ family response regulator
MIRVAIADDQHLFAESLKVVLEGESENEFEVCGIASDGKEAIELVSNTEPDVVLMDIRMPVMDGVQATAHIHEHHPNVRIMILTTFDDDELAVSALSAGATGYILKNVRPAELIVSIRALATGALYVSPTVGRKLVEKARLEGDDSDRKASLQTSVLLSHYPSLTRREAEILRCVARAWSNKEIASRLSVSEKTVKNHLTAIFDKLNNHNRLQLISQTAALLDAESPK